MVDFPTPKSQHQFVRQWAWLPLLVSCLAVLMGGAVNNWPQLSPTVDIDQPRLDTAVPAPRPSQPLNQTIVPRHDGFSEIELLLIHYDEANRDNSALATLTLKDANGRIIASQRFVNNQTTHNQTAKLVFPPQQDSLGQRYTLSMNGQDGNRLGVWGYSLPLLGDETLVSTQETAAQTLYFKTRYTLTRQTAWQTIGEQFLRYGWPLALIFFWLPLPGLLLLVWWPTAETDRWPWLINWGMATALGIAIWPLVWYWWSFIGHFSSAGLWALFVLGWLAFLYKKSGFNQAADSTPDSFSPVPRSSFPFLLFPFFFLAVLALRLLTVRDLVFLPWVDASRHGLITAVFADAGYWSNSYQPFLPVTDGFYHYGFHTLSASLHLMLGDLISLNELLLILMQALSALICLTVFSGVWLLIRNTAAAWIAAFFVAIPFLMPSYYTTWGRLTQLTAVLLLPIAVALTWSLLAQRKDRQVWVWLALIVASIALIHMRVFMIYLPAVVLFVLFAWRTVSKTIVSLLLSGTLALALIAPRLWQVVAQFLARRAILLEKVPSGGNFNRFPTGYVTTGWEQWFWWGLGLGLIVMLAVWWKTQKDEEGSDLYFSRPVWAISLWMGAVLLLTAGTNLHPDLPTFLPEVSVNSAYISLFVPLSFVLGMLLVGVHRFVAKQHWLAHLSLYLTWGALFTALTLFGIPHQLNILNDTTLLGRTADIEALEWVRQHTSPQAKIAHSSWKWLGETWAGQDGGAWIVPLTGRMSTTPPIDHVYNPDLFADVRGFNEMAHSIEDWSTPATADFLRQHGVDYIFIGEKGGYFDPAELSRNEDLILVYQQEAAFVFALAPR